MSNFIVKGKTGNYGITYASNIGSVNVARQEGQTRTTVTKPIGKTVVARVSGGKNQATTFGVSKTKNNTTFSISATPRQKSYGIRYSKRFK